MNQQAQSKKQRSLKRLLVFLIKKAEQGEKIKIDIFQLMFDLKEKIANSFLENRLFSVIATVQQSDHDWRTEGLAINSMFGSQKRKYKMLDKSNQKFKVLKSKLEPLSSNETRNRGFTHRYRIKLIVNLSVNKNDAKEYIEKDLCRFRGTTLSSGERLYFQIEYG